MSISRREFVVLASSALAMMAAPTLNAQSLRVRREIRTLGATDIATLKDGVAAMRALPIADFRSWMYQAGVHGAPAGSGAGVPDAATYWNQCVHSGSHFVSWHRWELFFIEEIIRLMSNRCEFTLPYWDYIANGFLPDPLRTPANSSNPLYHASRSAALNAGTGALSGLNTSALNNTAFNTFSSTLYGNPHSAVHGQIGGDMGSVPTAARDPVFYLHHCNIDRYWECWLRMGSGRANPGSPWPEQTFAFRSLSGHRQALAGDVGRTADVGYTYDNLPCGRVIDPHILDALRHLRLIRVPVRPPRPRPEPDPWPWRQVVAFDPIVLTAQPSAVVLPRRELQRTELKNALSNARAAAVAVVLRDIEMSTRAREGGFFMEAWFAPRVGALKSSGLKGATLIGSFSSFDLSGHEGHAADQGAAATPLAPLAFALPDAARRALLDGDDDSAIVFVRRGLVDRAGKPLPFDERAELFNVRGFGIEIGK